MTNIIDRLDAAFDTLAEQGFATVRGTECCSGCSLAMLGPEDTDYVFWHQQDEERITERTASDLYIGWGVSDPSHWHLIVGALLAAGLLVDHDGSEKTRIRVALGKQARESTN